MSNNEKMKNNCNVLNSLKLPGVEADFMSDSGIAWVTATYFEQMGVELKDEWIYWTYDSNDKFQILNIIDEENRIHEIIFDFNKFETGKITSQKLIVKQLELNYTDLPKYDSYSQEFSEPKIEYLKLQTEHREIIIDKKKCKSNKELKYIQNEIMNLI